MTRISSRSLHSCITQFVAFKHALGYKYIRARLALLSFERFIFTVGGVNRRMSLDQAMLAWIASTPGRKPLTVGFYISVLRGLCAFLRREGRPVDPEPIWPRVPTTSNFLPTVLSLDQVRELVRRARGLDRPTFRGRVFGTLILLLYCTGLRFGEAVRVRFGDIDTRDGVIVVPESKGRSRVVPLHHTMVRELTRYLDERRKFEGCGPADAVFIGSNGKALRVQTASITVCNLLRAAGFKPPAGRIGPRPYDLRHTFAVHRLTRWYRAGVDLHARLPWLSAYMGHDDMLGTEVYLKATPELLALAGHRFHERYVGCRRWKE